MQFCKWISDSFWKDVSTLWSQLLNETLQEKAAQVPPIGPASPPGRAQEVPPSQDAAVRMHLGRDDKMSHFIQYPASAWEKEGMQMVQETVPFRSEKPQIKAYFFC